MAIDKFEESIDCIKDGVTKKFSQHQLDTIGENHSGTYDGWAIVAKKPKGIPEAVAVTVPPVVSDPLVLTPVETTPADPVVTPPALPETPVVEPTPTTPADPVDPTKVETVVKTSKAKP